MKNLILILSFLFLSGILNAQTLKFSEDFESLPLSVTSTGTATWARSSVLQVSGTYSDSAVFVNTGDSAVLTTNAINISGYSNLQLRFDQICKIEFFDEAYIEVSIDNGINWTRLTGANYQGLGQFGSFGNKFSSGSYPVAWDPANNFAIPTNAWWQHETFNLNGFAGSITQFKVRFILKDGNNSGAAGNYGWLLDNIELYGSSAEMDPPSITYLYPVLQDTIYGAGPYKITADIIDNSGIDSVVVVYEVNGISDTVAMVNVYNDRYVGFIPSHQYFTTICYHIVARDNSANNNIAKNPTTTCISFTNKEQPMVVNIGTNTSSTTYYSPIYNGSTTSSYNYSEHISLIDASEMNGYHGYIDKISFSKGNTVGYPNGNASLKIYLKSVDTNSVPTATSSFQNEIIGATLVYSSTTQSISANSVWLEAPLISNAFNYDGVSNIMVLVEWDRTSPLTTSYIRWHYTSLTDKAVTFVGTNQSPGVLTYNGYRPNMKIELSRNQVDYDVALDTIASPQPVILTTSTTPFNVRIGNAGDSLLTKATLNWEVDNVLQTPSIWTGNLQYGMVSNDILLGNYQFTTGSHDVKVWASAPNDSIDVVGVNDTIKMSVFGCLSVMSGNYSLGGASADFPTVADLMLQLNNCGLGGPTTIKINPGVYQEQMMFVDSIPGLDSINTLTITSATNNPTDVTFEFSPTALSPYVIGLNGVNYLTIKGIRVKSNSTLANGAIYLYNNASNNVIDSCIIIAPSGNYNNVAPIYATAENNNFNTIINNKIIGGYYAIHYNGLSNNYNEGNVISYNELTKFHRTGIYLTYQESPTVNYNNVFKEYEAGSPNITSLYLYYCPELTAIGNESVIETNGSAYGIYLNQCSGTTSNHSSFINNISIVKGTSTSTSYRALYVANSSLLDIYNNTFATYSGSSNSEVAYVSNSGYSDVQFVNNVFASFGGNYAFEAASTSTASISLMDYNDYYTSGGIVMKWGVTSVPKSGGISAIQVVTLLDTNSVSVDPMLYSQSNGRSFAQALQSAATPLSNVPFDIDMNPRSTIAPSIGALEFTVANIDAGVLSIVDPLAVDTQSRVVNIKAVIRNFGIDTIQSMDIKYSLNNASPINYAWTGTLDPTEIDTISIGSITLPVMDYNLVVYTDIALDSNYYNDTLDIDYFALPLIDAQIVSMDSPIDGCGKDTTEVVEISIINNGVNDINTGLTASYQILGSSNIITENVINSIAAGATITYQFAQKVDMTPQGSDSIYTFILSVNHASDANHNNDTLLADALSMSQLPSPIISDTTILYGDTVQLIAVSNDPIQWYSNDTITNVLVSGNTYTTPILYDTTSYWLQSNTNIAPSTAVMGTGTSMYGNWDVTVYGGGNSAGKYQMLYLASELSSAGLIAGQIESIAFQTAAAFNQPAQTYEIHMANVSINSLSSNFVNTSMTTVYNQTFSIVAGWNTHTLTTPFVWDGMSSILVEICATGISYFSAPVQYTTTSFVSYAAAGGMGVSCASTTAGNSYYNTHRPNTKFKTTSAVGCSSARIPVTVNVPLPQFDGMVADIVGPIDDCGLAQAPIVIDIVNMGTDTLAGGFTTAYRIDNGAYISPETVSSSINPGDTLRYTFNTLAALNPGANGKKYMITAKVNIASDTYPPNDSLSSDSIFSKYTPTNPIVSNQTISYGSTTSLAGTASDSLFWHADSNLTQLIGIGNPFLTSPLYDTTTFWVISQRNKADSIYQFGTGTGVSGINGPSPYGVNALGARHQFMIKASELTAMGLIQGYISSISFNAINVKSNIMRNYTISIGNSDYSDMSQSYFDSTLTMVSGPTDFMEVFGWNTHTFSSPYFWDGISNLIIETCFKSTSNLTFVGVGYSPTSFVSTAQAKGTSLFNCSNPTINTTYSQRPNIKIQQEGFGLCQSDIFPLVVNVTNYPTVDASISEILTPINTASSCVSTPIKVVLKNYGLNNLTSASINWSENSINQTAYNWTGNLAHGAVDTVTIATTNLLGGTNTINSWVVVSGDNIGTNDTNSTTVKVLMSGSYAIGVNSRYPTFNSAAADLIDCGICGPVIFSVDSGNYTEKIIIPAIVGSSPTNTITFQSATMDSTDVVINTSTSMQYNYILLLRGAEYINIRSLTLTANGSTYGNVIVLENGANNINIENNVLNSTVTSVYTAEASCVFAQNHNTHSILINNNNINSGYKGINFKHTSYGHFSNIQITNNSVKDFVYYGVYFYYCDSVTIENNYIQDLGVNNTAYGIYGYYLRNGFQINKNIIDLIPTSAAYGIYLKGAGTTSNRALISNNMLSFQTGLSTKYGIHVYSSDYVDIVYNSINIASGSTTSRGMYFSNGSSLRLINNNSATSIGYALYVTAPNAFTQMDYNNYYTDTTSSLFVHWGASDVGTLAMLQSFDITKNVNSMRVEPLYFSVNDLHSQQFGLYNTATPFSQVTTDIDEDIRSTTAPSIGADEFTPPAIDLGVLSMPYPIMQSCSFIASDSIIINIRNFGLNNINFATTPASIIVEITGINPDTITFALNSGSLASGAIDDYVITTNYDLSANGIYNFNSHIIISGDGNSSNDAMAPVEVISFPTISNFPFNENFESGNNISFRTESGTDADISVTSFSANNSNFGLQLTGGAYYNWVNPNNVNQAFANTAHASTAYSCNVDATNINHLNLKFDLKQTGYSTTSLNTYNWFRVLLIDNNGTHYLTNAVGDSVFKPITANNDPFTSHIFVLDSYIGQSFSIRFEAVNRYAYGSGSYDGDNVLIDNIVIWEPNSIDLGVNSIVTGSNFGPSGTISTVKVAIENYGLDTLFDIPLAYQVNGGVISRDTLYTSLAPLSQDTFTFSQTFALATGINQVCVFGEYPNDAVSANDTTCTNYKGLKTLYPNYSDDFEATNYWMPVGSSNQWELGTPSTTNISSAHSGSNAWATILNGDYLTSSTEYLYTPYFTILPYADSITVEFWQFMRTHPSKAFGELEYSFNGVLWSSIGYIGIPNSQNWYTTNVSGKHKWNMMNTTWIKSWIKLDPATFNTGATVQFRFKFETISYNLSEEGWAIDDFKLFFPPLQFDAGITEIILPSDSLILGSNHSVRVKIKNFGTDTISNVPIGYQINGMNTVLEAYAGSILPDSTVEHLFTVPFSVTNITQSICAYTDLSTDMQHINDTLCKNFTILSPALDAGVSSIIAPFGQTTIGQATQVQVYITNYGTDTLSNVDVRYSAVGSYSPIETFIGTILPGDSVAYVFTNNFISPAGNYGVCARTLLTNDAYPDNDSICVYVIGTGINDASGDQFVVAQNKPNPAKAHSIIEYYIPKSGTVQFKLTNILGEQLIQLESQNSQGKHQWSIDARKLNAGIYYYTIIFDGLSITKKITVIK